MGKKKGSTFEEIATNFELDGHDTLVKETDARKIDKGMKRASRNPW